MKLAALRLHNVRRFGARGVAIEGIGDGVNVLTAANEHGKSTAFEALHALFFQPHTSVGKPVQLLRPYSGGNPVVEADIATDDGMFRLTKQFCGGRRASVFDLGSGQIVAQADEAEGFISDLTRGGSAGPAGLLWVRQGVTGIEQRNTSEERAERQVRETLLSSVQGEVEAVTGGRRMSEILEACEQELSKLVTEKQRRPVGRYSDAIKERERLANEVERLDADVAALHEALVKRRAARARLADVENTEQREAQRLAIAEAEEAVEAARAHSETLKAAEAQVALARREHESALSALDDYRTALERAEVIRHQREDALRKRDLAVARRNELAAQGDVAQRAVESAEAEERAGRVLLGRLEAALRACEAAEQLEQMQARLQAAEAARVQVEQIEAALAVLDIPERALQQLQAYEVELVRLRAAHAASLPTLRLDYEPGAEGAVRLSGEPLEGGKDVGFAASIQLEIAGVGSLTLRSNRPVDEDEGLAQAEERYQNLLASLAVGNLSEAQQRHVQAREKAAELQAARQRLSDFAPQGVAQLQAEVARIADAAAPEADLELKGDPAAVREALVAAEEAVSAARNKARELGLALARAQEGVTEAEAALARLEGDLTGVGSRLGPVEGRAEKLQALTDAEARLKETRVSVEARLAALRPLASGLAATEANLRRLRSIAAAAEQEARQLHSEIAELNGWIAARNNDAVEEVLEEARDALAAAEAEVARFETEVAVLDRLRRELISARTAARDLYLKPIISELRPLLGLLFDDITIEFSEETLLPRSVRRNGQDEEVDRLSGGMREQLSVLTRLAFARLLARDGRATPVILDDALAYSDDDRIERMFDALHHQAADQQILVFSCRQRAFSRLGGNVLRMVDWAGPV